jgi:WD40 repeat protein
MDTCNRTTVGVGLTLLVACTFAHGQPPADTTLEGKVDGRLKQRDCAGAIKAVVGALEKNPQDAAAAGLLSVVFDYSVIVGQDGALEDGLKAWVAAQPRSAIARCWTAKAAAHRGGTGAAIEQCQEALKLDPNCPDAHFGLATALELLGQAEKAQAEWRKFLELEPNSDRAWLVKHGLAVVETRPLTREPTVAMEWDPSWSPDGKQVAYRNGWEGALGVARVENGEARALAVVPEKLGSVDWSPDGKSILCTGASADWLTTRLYLVDAVAGGAPTLMHEISPSYNAQWAPDGARVIFDAASRAGLRVLTVGGAGEEPVPGYAALRNFHTYPSFSPNGQNVCTSGGKPTNREIFLWPFATGSPQVQLTRNGGMNNLPTMRPDGKTVLYASRVEGDTFDLRVVSADEPGREVVCFRCFFGDRYGPWADWSPDGRHFVAPRPFPGRLWLATVGGLDTRPLKLAATQQAGGLLVSLASASADAQTGNVTYQLFDPNSVRLADGVVGQDAMALKPGEVVECPVALAAAKEAGTHTVKLTAVTGKGERVVELVDYEVK